MTAPAAAPAAAPVAPAAQRAPAQTPADRFAFSAVLDSLPGSPTKAGSSTVESEPHPSDEPPQDQSARGQTAGHLLLSDGALLTSLPFALGAASAMEERPEAADNDPSLFPVTMKGPGLKDSGASITAAAKAATVGRVIDERAFHFGASPSAGVFASLPAVDAPFAPAESMPARPFANAAPSSDSAPAAASIAPHAGAALTNRMSPTQAAAREAAQGGRKPEAVAPPPAARASSSAAPPAPAESNGKAADLRASDPTMTTAPPAAQADPFGAPLSAPFGVATPFGPDGSTAGAADIGVASRASPLAAGSAPSTPPVREIDVDLSPSGLEDVSMTMRLANDKLSVVIRAASSQTLGSIEGARDAIADRLAAIGQPLDALIVKQTGVNADGNTNGNAASADSGASEWGSTQGAGERGGSSDASLSRRGAGRDRSF